MTSATLDTLLSGMALENAHVLESVKILDPVKAGFKCQRSHFHELVWSLSKILKFSEPIYICKFGIKKTELITFSLMYFFFFAIYYALC